MANTIDTTQAAPFIPEIWANEALAILRENIAVAPRVLRDTDVAAFQRGDVLHIPYPGTLAASDKAAGTEYTLAQPTGEADVQLTLNKHKAVSFVVEDVSRAQSSQDLVRRYSEASAIAIAEVIEDDLIAAIQAATGSVGTYGDDAGAALLRTARKTFTDNKVPQSDRYMALSSKDWAALLGDSGLTQFFANAQPDAVRSGELVRLYGFEMFESQGVAVADGANGEITLTTSAAADDIIDTTAAHGFAAGDRVKFTALTGGTGLSTDTIYYVIAANLAAQTFQVSATEGGSAIDFSTNITAGTVVKPEASNIAWRRDGVMLAMRGMPEPPVNSGATAAVVRDPDSGLVLRTVMSYDGRLGGVQVTIEALYGVKLLQDAKALVVRS